MGGDTVCAAPELRWAHRFRAHCVEGRLHLTLLEPWRNLGETVTYVLIPAGSGWPGSAAARTPPSDTVWVRLPLRRVAALVSAQSAFIAALGSERNLVAVAAKRFLYDSSLRARIDAGEVLEVGDGPGLDLEKLTLLKTDAVFHGGSFDPGLDGSPRIRGAGMLPIAGGEWMESHPLGRAEWLQFYGALLGRGALADSLFRAVEAAYTRMRDSLAASASGPKVLCGAPWQGQWHIPGGRSYPSQLARDAGLRYLWAEDSSEGSLAMAPEAVLARGSTADIWLNPGSFTSLRQARSDDSRYSHLPAFRSGLVYAPTRRTTADGGNDYWETAVVRPDWLLADLAAIARQARPSRLEQGHPDSLGVYPDEVSPELRYWLRLPAR